MKIFIFGNEDLPEDSLPLRILPILQKKFPNIKFETIDPNEDFDFPENITVIDTVFGIKDITIFDSLEKFSAPPRVGMHDFDALTNLCYLQKLGKIKTVKIIAVPPKIGELEAVEKISEILQDLTL